MLQVVTTGAEYKLKDLLEGIKESAAGWRAQHFRLSNYKGELGVREASKVAFNIISGLLRDEDGGLFFCHDGDIVILCKGVLKKDFDEIAYQLTYLLADAAPGSGTGEDFHTLYDMTVHWGKIHSLTLEKIRRTQMAPLTRPDLLVTREDDDVSLEAIVERDSARLALMRRRHRSKPCVLLVDDDMITLRLARSTLGGNFGIVTASSGVDAYNAYLLNAPDVVFMDIGLPDTDGHSVLRRIMAIDPAAYVVMLSANSYRDDILKALQIGAKGFIGKPFTREKLLQAIEKCPRCEGNICETAEARA